MKTLPISEMFTSIQGEGYYLGVPSLFIRVAGCSFHPGCKFCDSKYALTKGDKISLDKIVNLWEVEAFNNNLHHIVITGGEPMLYVPQLIDLIEQIEKLGVSCDFEFETNGVIYPEALVDYLRENIVRFMFTVSPKLSNAGIPYDKRIKTDVLKKYQKVIRDGGNVVFKFVVKDKKGFDEVDKIVNEIQIHPRNVIIMPEAVQPKAVLAISKKIIDLCISRGYRYSPRMHVLIWGRKRGV